MSLSPRIHKSAQQRGVGLVEVLVAMVVLSIGFAASARFQIMSMRENQSSLYRGQASFLVESMMERMRNNPGGVQDGAYNAADTDTAGVPGGCRLIKCTPAQLAQEDIALWRHSIAPLDGSPPKLPPYNNGAPARGTVSAPVDGVYNVQVTWESLVDGEVQTQSLAMSFRP